MKVDLDVTTWEDDRIDLDGVWPTSLALADLAFWKLEMTPTRPSIRMLAERWSWKKDRAHRLIKIFESAYQTVGRQPTKEEPTQSAENRTLIGQSPIEASSDWIEAADRYVALTGARTYGPKRPSRKDGTGRALNARIKDHGLAAVLTVFDWWAHSDHQRARFLRAQKIPLKTILKPDKFQTYLGFAKHEGEAGNIEGAWIEPEAPTSPTEEQLWS